jgi:two-component system, NarL family, nitrate/nitrite response regulator NarL
MSETLDRETLDRETLDRADPVVLAAQPGLRVRVHASDPLRRRGLVVLLTAAGHSITDDTPDVELCDSTATRSEESEAPAVLLSDKLPVSPLPAGWLGADPPPAQLDAALRAVAAGLLVRSTPFIEARPAFAPADEAPLLTPREREILTLLGEGLSNKAMARRLGISVHTVKFHLEALFTKLDATSRAEAVAKGLRGGVIEL